MDAAGRNQPGNAQSRTLRVMPRLQPWGLLHTIQKWIGMEKLWQQRWP